MRWTERLRSGGTFAFHSPDCPEVSPCLGGWLAVLAVRAAGSGQTANGSGLAADGSGFQVDGSGLAANGSRFWVNGSGFAAAGSGFRVDGLALADNRSGFRVDGSGLADNRSAVRVNGSGFRATVFRVDRAEGESVVIGFLNTTAAEGENRHVHRIGGEEGRRG